VQQVLLSTRLACRSCFQRRLACNCDFFNTTILLRVVSKAQKTSEFDGFPAQLDLRAHLSTTCYSDPTCRSLQEIRRICTRHAGWAQLWIFSVGIISDSMAAQMAWALVHRVLLNARLLNSRFSGWILNSFSECWIDPQEKKNTSCSSNGVHHCYHPSSLVWPNNMKKLSSKGMKHEGFQLRDWWYLSTMVVTNTTSLAPARGGSCSKPASLQSQGLFF
jgi:hypothetical protein